MSAITRRDQEKAEIRERILGAARELLLGEGIAGFSMRKLAAKIGYTATAIYFHFADKETLLRELVDCDSTSLRVSLDKAGKIDDPVTRIQVMGTAYIEFGIQNPDHYRLLFMTRTDPSVLAPLNEKRDDPAQCGYAFLRQAVGEALQKGYFRPEFTDPEQLCQVIWAGVHGIVSLHMVLGQDAWFQWRPIKETGNQIIQTTLRGLMAKDS